MANKAFPIFVTIPHSGEQVPDQCTWLQGLPEPLLMCDVDRYVDLLYEPAIQKLAWPLVKTKWHRYAADLNRFPEDVDAGSVEGNQNPKGQFARGFHWQMTTKKETLMSEPMTKAVHDQLVQLVHTPFHADIQKLIQEFRQTSGAPIFHLDLHSMPSLGTSEHRDPGETRADIVVSDCSQKSSRSDFVDLVITSYVRAGFKVAYNWPYLGGRVSEQYGQPSLGHHTVQVELSRKLYMDEVTKKLEPRHQDLKPRLQKALENIAAGLPKLLS